MRRNNSKKLQKGSAIVIMIVTIAVMMLISVSFLSSSSYTYKFTKALGDADSTFFAAESASRRWFSLTRETVENNQYYAINHELEYKKEAEYVESVLNEIRGESGWKEQIKVNGDNGRVYTCDFGRFEIYSAERKTGTLGSLIGKPVVRAEVGLLSVSNCTLAESPEVITTNNKRLLFQDVIEIPYFAPIKLTSAVLSIGDVVAQGVDYGTPSGVLAESIIIGDVNSFGSFPSMTLSPKQYFFGGIMAIRNAKLNIFGNAYTRGFVRVGAYIDAATGLLKVLDESEINVTKDILAQCIQTFSRKGKIYAYRNAYTLDDLEINGEESIVGINGSFFGLNDNKDATNHDETSCILNSSALHYTMETTSLSRVVINGDVVLAGSGYKIKQDGTGDFEIESAGLIFPEENDGFTSRLPCYKYEDEIIKFAGAEPSDRYINFLKNSMIRKFGYVNIIQGHNPIATGYGPSSSYTDIEDWKKEIDLLRSDPAVQYKNKWPVSEYFKQPKSALLKNEISGITGSTIVGANDGLYWDDDYTSDPALVTGVKGSVIKPRWLNLDYSLDGFTPSDLAVSYISPTGTGLNIHNPLDEEIYAELTTNVQADMETFWKSYWKDRGIHDWDEYWQFAKNNTLFSPTANISEYIDVMKSKEGLGYGWSAGYNSHLPNLKNLIESKLNTLATRSYPAMGFTAWNYDMRTTIKETIEKIEALQKKIGTFGDNIIIIEDDLTASATETPLNVGTLACGYDNSEPYLVVCKDPNVDVIVNGTFRGIILAKGRVRIQKNGKVLGSVIATGRFGNDKNKSTADGKLYMNTFSQLDLGGVNMMNNLNNGEYAGVILEANVGAGTMPTVDFYYGENTDNTTLYNNLSNAYSNWMGRDFLLKKFNDVGVPLYQIF